MKTTTSLKIDNHIKKEASEIASSLGLNLSIIINASLRNFIAEKRITFSIDPEFNKGTTKEITSIRGDIRKRKNIEGPFTNIKDLRNALLR